MAPNVNILRTVRRLVLRVLTDLNEMEVYARRLLSHDKLSPKELDLYVSRRRQALLFYATQTDPVFRVWKTAHPDEARFCSESGWDSIPTFEPEENAPATTSVAQRANAARVLAWWSKKDNDKIQKLGEQELSLELVQHPKDLKKVGPQLHHRSATVPCLSVGDGRVIGAPCPEAGAYHFLSDMFLLDSTESTDAGCIEQYLTDLDSRAELFIRQRLPFTLHFKEGPCPCGRPFPIIDREN